MSIETIFDPVGFPMVYIPPIKAYIHWLPFTKIQLEYFLSITNDAKYDDAWYTALLNLNERISPGAIRKHNYWKAFATGILPKEARDIATEFGREFDLPSAEQWLQAYRYLDSTDAHPDYLNNLILPMTNDAGIGLRERTQILVKNIEMALSQNAQMLEGKRTLADQFAMRLGVMEYVFGSNTSQQLTYVGYGQPHMQFFSNMENPRKGEPQVLIKPTEGARMPHYGFRLIRYRD